MRTGRLAELVAPWLGEQGQPAFYRQIAAYDESYLTENETLLNRIDIPVSVLWGTEDTWIPIATGRRLAAGTPGANLASLPHFTLYVIRGAHEVLICAP